MKNASGGVEAVGGLKGNFITRWPAVDARKKLEGQTQKIEKHDRKWAIQFRFID